MKFLVMILIFSLVMPAGLVSAGSTPTPPPVRLPTAEVSDSDENTCDSRCKAQEVFTKQEIERCKNSPLSKQLAAIQRPVDCEKSTHSQTTNLASYCSSFNLADTAATYEWVSTGVFAAAAVTCGIACYYPAVVPFCYVGGGLAMVGDLIAEGVLANKFGQSFGDYMKTAGGEIGAGVGGAMAVGSAYAMIPSLAPAAAGAGTAVAGTGTAAGSAAPAVATKASKVPCYAAGAFLAISVLKFKSVGAQNSSKDASCNSILSLNGRDLMGLSNTNNTGPSGVGFGSGGQMNPVTGKVSANKNDGAKSKGSVADQIKGDGSDLTTGVLASAIAGKEGELFKKLFPDPTKFGSDFKKASGVDLKDFVRKVESSSPSQAMAALASLSPEVSKLASNMEKFLDREMAKGNGAIGSSYAGGGGSTKAAAKAKAGPALGWGSFG
ncbi:hypothetical protein WDW86_02760, partial [Bdellovibrionota bacterium FG-2]